MNITYGNLMKTIIFLILLNALDVNSQCILRFKDDDLKKGLLNKLRSLDANKYTTSSSEIKYKSESFIKYEFKICTCPNQDSKHPNASIIQYQYTNNQWTMSNIIGEHTEIDIDGGNNWYTITYYNGDKYNEICTNIGRKGRVMIICDSTVDKPTFNFLYEYKHAPSKSPKDNNSSVNVPHCGYLFELRLWDENICSGKPNSSGKDKGRKGKSNGSILCILFFTFFGGYLIIGALYKRFVQGAFGIEQIPNLNAWRNFLELQADGCDYFFRQNPIAKGHPNRRNDYSHIIGTDSTVNRTTSGFDINSPQPNQVPGSYNTTVPGNLSMGPDENLLR